MENDTSTIYDALIVDAGSTKTQWLIADTGKSIVTPGINPVHLDDEALTSLISKAIASLPEGIYRNVAWYGAGCGSPEQCDRLRQILLTILDGCQHVFVGSDLLCAAKATAADKPAIVCILGTGSNCGVYDGHEIIDNIPPLGYILGDEGSGAAIGKRLINAVLKRRLSAKLTEQLCAEVNLNKEYVQQQVYRTPYANRYLASLAKSVAKYIDNAELKGLVSEEIDAFLKNNVLRYSQAHKLPIHFVGGAAGIFSDILRERLDHFGLRCGIIAPSPLDIPGDPYRFIP